MINKALLLILSVVLSAVMLSGFPAQREKNAIVSPSIHQTTDNSIRPSNGENAKQIPLPHRNARYQLSEGDVLDLDFPFTPEFNQTITVLPDGYVSLRGVGSLRVEGETVPELRRSLQRVYSKILRQPVITVVLKDFEKPYFIVGGQVRNPGKFDLRGDKTVMQAIDIAGGFTGNAKHSQILLFRKVSDDWVEVKKLNLKAMLRGKNLNEDPHLRPGDMLFVPKNTVSKIKQFIPSTGMGLYYNPAGY